VQLLKKIMVLVLVACWLPASSHALLQSAGLIHHVHADHDHEDISGSHEHDSDNHELADGKCAFSATHLSAPSPNMFATLLFSTFGVAQDFQIQAVSIGSGLAPPGAAPPEFPKCWQFVFRTASPPRAPSFVS
jgi:hypothetical protein